ncbi:sulfatase family protein [Allorhodopirellula solitaria]|uniref:Arylsulfatase n=1 Tax=Allorhodopirellula solitaria TaxID=2527987 RepID=A0A5C5XXV7_9BACT|nr:sulfatase [Allorhodopirellula solitaria]TWT67389.1 Arylsulfatase [Allorhodopirellula solitaria]
MIMLANRILPLLLLLTPHFATAPTAIADEQRPNIVFLFSDDLTTQAISAYQYGLDLPPTPNFDRLAKEGMLFENSFCGNSICTPSRATVMTGLHSHKNGIVHLRGALDPQRPTWPKKLHQSGYATAVFGKWHMKTKPNGFDDWEVFGGQGSYYNPDLYGPEGKRRVEGHSTDIVTDIALDWLDNRDQNKPFALLIQHKAPHRNWKPSIQELELYRDITFSEPPSLFDNYESRVAASNHKMGIDEHMTMASDLMLFQGDEDKQINRVLGRLTPDQRKAYLAAFESENAAFIADPPTGKDLVRWKYQRYMQNYLRCVAGVDRNVGKVLDRLDALNLSENTIVVYCADQGFYLGEHGWFDKRWAYEESLKMPLIVRWPGKVEPGTRSQAMVQNIDYAPTLLDAAGVKTDWDVDGISLMPLLSNGGATPDDWRKTIYYRYIDGGHGVAQHSAIRTNTHKLLHFDQPRNEAEKASIWELYDLQNDPQEMTNLAGDPAHAEKLESMKKLFWQTRKYYDDTDEEVWTNQTTERYAPEDYIR